jgi:adenylate cyclase
MKARTFGFAIISALGLTLFLAVLQQVEFFQKYELGTLDWRLRDRQKTQHRAPDDRLFFVSIDNKTTGDFGAWPFSRTYHAQLLSLLTDEKPGTVTWDILFTEPKAKIDMAVGQLAEEDAQLVEAAKVTPTLITAASRDETGQRKLPENLGPTHPLTHIQGNTAHLIRYPVAQVPFDPLIQYSRFGYADCEPGWGGVRRYLPMIVEIDGRVFPSLVLQTLMTYWAVPEDKVEIVVGKEVVIPRPEGAPLRIPIDKTGSFLINFRQTLADFPQMSYVDLGVELDLKHTPQPDRTPKIPPLTGKMVVFGFSGTGFDTGPTPLEENSPLVIFHLNALNNILQGDYLRTMPTWAWLAGFAVVALLLAVVMLSANVYGGVVAAIVTAGGMVMGGYVAVVWGNLWLPVFLPVVGIVLLFAVIMCYRFFGEEREKIKVRKALGSYLSENVRRVILDNAGDVKLTGMKREITVMFCDIRGFTKYCETKEPEKVVSVLNEYLNLMTEVIIKYDGTLDKYVGDCIMAFWGAPLQQADHAQRAVCCALEMRYALSHYKAQRAGLDQEVFECGIGINTGDALVGNLGSDRLQNYTIIGSTVNLAARLESLTKTFTCRIIISEATRQKIDGDFTVTELGDVLVPGFSVKTKLYSVEAMQDITSALSVGKKLAEKQEYTAADVSEPIWQPAPLPEDADPNP